MRATAEPSRGPTPTTAAMPLEELEPDTDLSIWSARGRKRGERRREARLGESSYLATCYLARQQAGSSRFRASSFERRLRVRVVGLEKAAVPSPLPRFLPAFNGRAGAHRNRSRHNDGVFASGKEGERIWRAGWRGVLSSEISSTHSAGVLRAAPDTFANFDTPPMLTTKH